MKDELTVLLLTRLYFPDVGGVPKYYTNIIKYTDIPFKVVTRQREDITNKESPDNNVIRPCKLPENLSLTLSFEYFTLLFRFTLWLFNECKYRKSLIVVGQARFFFLFSSWLVCKLLKKNYVVWLHGEELPLPKNLTKSQAIERYLLSNSSLVICNSYFTRSRFLSLIPNYYNEIIISFPGVEEEFFSRSITNIKLSEILRHDLKLENKIVLYTIARLDKRKGHDKVLESLPIIKQTYPDVIYLIGGIGPSKQRLTSLIEKLGLEESVKFLGMIDSSQMNAYHLLGDIFLMPNRTLMDGDTEGFGIVFLEANAVGNPVIGGEYGGVVDAIENEISGILVDSINPYAIAQAVVKLIDDRDMAKKMGIAGRKRAYNNFRWPILGQRFESNFVPHLERLVNKQSIK